MLESKTGALVFVVRFIFIGKIVLQREGKTDLPSAGLFPQMTTPARAELVPLSVSSSPEIAETRQLSGPFSMTCELGPVILY